MDHTNKNIYLISGNCVTLEEGQKICPGKKKIAEEIKHCCKRLFVNGTVNQVMLRIKVALGIFDFEIERGYLNNVNIACSYFKRIILNYDNCH